MHPKIHTRYNKIPKIPNYIRFKYTHYLTRMRKCLFCYHLHDSTTSRFKKTIQKTCSTEEDATYHVMLRDFLDVQNPNAYLDFHWFTCGKGRKEKCKVFIRLFVF